MLSWEFSGDFRGQSHLGPCQTNLAGKRFLRKEFMINFTQQLLFAFFQKP